MILFLIDWNSMLIIGVINVISINIRSGVINISVWSFLCFKVLVSVVLSGLLFCVVRI